MCGIVGFVGTEDAAHNVLEGLRRLEYRGYDSAGIATVHDGELHVRRRKGKIRELDEVLRNEPLAGSIAIGHTRWATHGKPSDSNAHPHRVDDIVLVHNGIIENYVELREELLGQGRNFESETDTEIVAHLVATSQGATLLERVRQALARVQGAYAIAVISTAEPDTIVVAKNASPLVLGVHEEMGLLASDIPALLPFTRDIIVLQEGEMATIQPGKISLYTLDGAPISREPKRIDWSPVAAEKGGHRHFMHKEMHEQPRAIVDTLRGRFTPAGDDVFLPEEIERAFEGSSRVVLSACGSAWITCVVGRLALEDLARIHCEVELASELRYRNPVMGPETLTITVSQSGETADTLAAIDASHELGSKVLSIVNVLDSTIARESDWVLYTHAGPEIGVASTKAFLTQVATLIMLAIGVGRRRGLSAERAAELVRGLREIPQHIEKTLHQEERIMEMASKLVGAQSAMFLGRGYGFPVALEGALKLKEISYIHAEGYAAGEMKHGPIALIEKGLPIIVVATEGPLYDKTLSNVQEAKARDGYVIAIATEGDTKLADIADDVVYVPKVDPMLMPLVATVPLQLLAYHVADQRGTDIDQPRNLAKAVTVE